MADLLSLPTRFFILATYLCLSLCPCVAVSVHSCSNDRNPCTSGTRCVGPVGKEMCQTPMLRGQRCNIDPYSVCRPGLICISNQCHIPLNANCQFNGRPSRFCVPGSHCARTSSDKYLCKRSMLHGQRCDIHPCRQELNCVNNRCRIPENGNCLFRGRESHFCVPGTRCVGTKDVKKCMKPMLRGQNCNTDPFCKCRQGLICIKERCHIPTNSRCLFRGRPSRFCVPGTVCTGTLRGMVCKVDNQRVTTCGADLL